MTGSPVPSPIPGLAAPMVGSVGHGSTAYWYLTRSTGLVSLVLLSATVVFGLVSSSGWTTERWPRFLSQGLHRNLSLYCIVLVGVHIFTTVADGYVPIGLADAVVPFVSPYRPLWVGLGALAFDLMVALAVTSGLRRRIGVRTWRGVHWLAYLCWPVAVLHGLGSGSDTRLTAGILVYVVCMFSVAGALAWRLVSVPSPSKSWRAAFGVGGVLALVGTAVFALQGPLRAGWSRRAGTSAAVLAEISRAPAQASSPTTAAGSPRGPAGAGRTSKRPSATAPSTPTSSPAPTTSALPPAPFSTRATGTLGTEQQGTDRVEVTIRLRLEGTSAPLVIDLIGTPDDGGVAMETGTVTFGPEQGTVTALDGSTISATTSGPVGALDLSMSLVLDQATGTVTGTVSGSSAQ